MPLTVQERHNTGKFLSEGFTQDFRERLAEIFEIVREDGLEGARDIDVLIEVLECEFKSMLSPR